MAVLSRLAAHGLALQKMYLMDVTGRYQHKLSTGKGAYLTPFWVRY